MPYITAMSASPVAVVESREFERQAAGLFALEEIEALKLHLAYDPTAGVVVPGTGGVRKLRWGAGGKGKRGGARVIYYYHSEALPLFLFGVYAKASKADLSPDQKRKLTRIVKDIAASQRRRQ
ncbi:MAG: type II toxin-antitoxin system RelE/ParE family toxin [Dongiaceae bacterium]